MMNMQKINSEDLREGMWFTTPVFFDDGENMFCAENKAITQNLLAVLKRWNIPYVLTYSNIHYPDEEIGSDDALETLDEVGELDTLEELDEIAPNAQSIEKISLNLSTADSQIISKFESLVSQTEQVFSTVAAKDKNMRANVDNITNDIYALLTTDYTEIVSYILASNSKENSLPLAAVTTAFLSALIALNMGQQERKIKSLITAALLHDVGMLDVPAKITQKAAKLTKEEYDLLQLHPLRSSQYAQFVLYYPNEISNIIIQHHERLDGTGYPEKAEGEKIITGARILAIADTFTAMISQKEYRDSIDGYNAMKSLLDSNEQQYDSNIIKLFVQIIGIYPIGSMVMLTNNAVAQVVQANPEMPFMPDVRIISQGGINASVGDIIKLKDMRTIRIVRALKQNEYSA